MGVFTSTKQFRLGLNLINPWWLSGASIDLDLDNGRYYDSSLSALKQPLAVVTDYLSCTRASVGYAKNSLGAWVGPFQNNVLRITDLGLLVEDARTNYLLNSDTPATQTTGSLGTGSYVLWVEGSGSATSSAGSATITGGGAATDGSPNLFTVTVAGTVVVTVSGGPPTRFQLEQAAAGFPSSYIPTTTTSATRAADAVSCVGNLATILGALPQSVFADIRMSASPDSYWQVVNNSTGSNISLLNAVAGVNNRIAMFNGSTTLPADLGGGLTLSGGVKVASAQATAQRSIVGGGGTVATDTVTTTALANPSLGSNINAGEHFYGLYRRLTVWNSKLADATLQALTAP